ncbi:MAG: hypothetical protein ACXIUB_01845 [Wenzhouxiangella sp.]
MTTLVLNELSQAERRRLGLPADADRLCPALAERLTLEKRRSGSDSNKMKACRESANRYFAGSVMTDVG